MPTKAMKEAWDDIWNMSDYALIDELGRPINEFDRMIEREALRRILAHLKDFKSGQDGVYQMQSEESASGTQQG